MTDTTSPRPNRDGLFEMATQQAGYFTTRQAHSRGYSSPLITHHVKRGAFVRVARGIYRFRDYPSSPREPVIVAWLAFGPDAAVSHESALEILGLADLIPDAVHITVPRKRRSTSRMDGVKVHTTLKPLEGDQITLREGVRLTAPARTIVDLAEAGSAPEQVAGAIRQALQRGLTTPQRLHEAAKQASPRVVEVIQGAIPGPAASRYGSAEAFRRALETRLTSMSRETGRSVTRLRKEVGFDRLLARLVLVASGRWVLKGGLALDYRFGDRARSTRDVDLAMAGGEASVTKDLLAAQEAEIGDYFRFAIERTEQPDEIDAGLAVRYHVRVELAGRNFDDFALDIGSDQPTEADDVQGPTLLAFAGLPPVVAPVIPLELQVAEKLHAYSRAYGNSGLPSTRVKDLVDMNLIADHAKLDARRLGHALEDTFSQRGTHDLPERLHAPPPSWKVPYAKLAKEVGLSGALEDGFRRVSELLDPLLREPGSTGIWDPEAAKWQLQQLPPPRGEASTA